MSTPDALILRLVEAIIGLQPKSFRKIAVDGVDGVGKTTFADALGRALRERQVPVIRASVDGFHHPRAIRYRQGRESPAGFYADSYDLDGLRRDLLDPLSPGGNGRYRTAIFDHREDKPVAAPLGSAERGSILVIDGLFLHRQELRGYWDLSIFLEAPFEVTFPRGAARGEGWGSPDPAAPSNQRYLGGQKLYFRTDDPKACANILIDNSNLLNPSILAWRL